MVNRIGIRHEDKYKMERRTPLAPVHIARLINDHGLKITVQSSSRRIFTDQQYVETGAEISNHLDHCPIIMGVKEIPYGKLEKQKTYIFFSHVIKGQAYNMPMLQKMMELGCNLIDYERITDDQNRRLIFFGRYAGLAGMINSFWSLGQKLNKEGFEDNPFAGIRQAHTYTSTADAMKEISLAAENIRESGLPAYLSPLIIGITGNGNVSKGAQEIIDLFPVLEITPEELENDSFRNQLSSQNLYKVIFRENHISRPKSTTAIFNLQEYYMHPEYYENNFDRYLPHLTILMNCMYWDDRYPRIITKKYTNKLYETGRLRLKVVGDVTCDPDGSIELTHKATNIEDPVYTYSPITEKSSMGFGSDGIAIMAVDILPSELPHDASIAFGDALAEFIKPIAEADFHQSFEKLSLPDSIKKALILHQGNLTPGYEYLEEFIRQSVI